MEPKLKEIKRVNKTQKQQVVALYRLWLQTLQYPIAYEGTRDDEHGHKIDVWAHPVDLATMEQLSNIFMTRVSVHTWKGLDKMDRLYITIF